MLRFPETILIDLRRMREMLKALTPKSTATEESEKRTFQKDLETIREAMENETLKIAEGFRLYSQTVNEYYSQFPPFGTSKVEQDFEDFIELIGHSVIVGNYFLISEWGVKYPLNNQSVLAGSQFLQGYVDSFRKAITENWQENKTKHRWPDEAVEYWQYLIKEWESQISRQ